MIAGLVALGVGALVLGLISGLAVFRVVYAIGRRRGLDEAGIVYLMRCPACPYQKAQDGRCTPSAYPGQE